MSRSEKKMQVCIFDEFISFLVFRSKWPKIKKISYHFQAKCKFFIQKTNKRKADDSNLKMKKSAVLFVYFLYNISEEIRGLTANNIGQTYGTLGRHLGDIGQTLGRQWADIGQILI